MMIYDDESEPTPSYTYEMGYLLLLAGDIESNPGPDTTACPCDLESFDKLIICENCEIQWHESCIGLKALTPKALEKVSVTHCIMCINVPNICEKVASRYKSENNSNQEIIEKLNKIEHNIIESIKDKRPVGPAYKDAAIKGNVEIMKKVEETNRLVKVQMKNDKTTENIKEKEARTKIVRKPVNPDITNSTKLRREFNKHFKNVIIKEATITAAGSYKLEFENIEDANTVQNNWKKDYLGGNSGMVKIGEQNSTGLVKFVYDDDLTEEDIEESIKENYPEARIELFKKGNNFTGMIKVVFKEERQLEESIKNKFKICNRKYLVEKFIHKPRVIICNVCQRFGHIALQCKSKNKPNCGKCAESGHESINCTKEERYHKCFLCKSDEHKTGSYKCGVVQERLEKLKRERQDG